MKRSLTYLRTALAVVVASTMMACNKAADHSASLPADAFLIYSANPASLKEKANIGKTDEEHMLGAVKDEAMRTLGVSTEGWDDLMSMANNAVDQKSNIHIAVSMKQAAYGSQPEVVMVFGLKSAADLEKVFDMVGEEMSDLTSRTEIDGSRVFTWGGKAYGSYIAVAYDDARAVAVVSQEDAAAASARAAGLLVQEPSAGLAGNKAVAGFLNHKHDMCFTLLMENMPAEMKSQLFMLPGGGSFAKMVYNVPVNFEKGRIVADYETAFTDSDARKEYEETYGKLSLRQTGALLRFVPEQSIGAFGSGIDGAELYKFVMKMPQVGMIAASIPQVKQIMDAIRGDVLFSLHDVVSEGWMTVPQGLFAVQVKDREIMNTIIGLTNGFAVTTLGENRYMFELDGLSLYFGLKDDVLYATTDPSSAAAINGENIARAESFRRVFEGGTGAMFVDFAPLRALVARMTAEGDIDDDDSAQAMNILTAFETLEVKGEGYTSQVVVNMTDKSRNSLEVIAGMIREHEAGN